MQKITPEIEPIEMRDPQAYDHVIFLSPLWDINITPHMLANVQSQRQAWPLFLCHVLRLSPNRPGQTCDPTAKRTDRASARAYARDLLLRSATGKQAKQHLCCLRSQGEGRGELPFFHEAIDEVVGWFQLDKGTDQLRSLDHREPTN
jgi:hypothetical protein